jgi:hypothetical protein
MKQNPVPYDSAEGGKSKGKRYSSARRNAVAFHTIKAAIR